MEKEYVITQDTLVSRNEQKYLISVIGDEAVMMNIDKGVYIGMNSVGSTIWNMLSSVLSVKDIISSLTEKYDISPEQCKKETLTYLQQMLEQDMVMIRH